MDKITQYYKITEIKPKTHELLMPFYKTSPEKINMNLNTIDLYYNKYTGAYEEKIIEGHSEGPNVVTVFQYDF
jgi:hypothetical protein